MATQFAYIEDICDLICGRRKTIPVHSISMRECYDGTWYPVELDILSDGAFPGVLPFSLNMEITVLAGHSRQKAGDYPFLWNFLDNWEHGYDEATMWAYYDYCEDHPDEDITEQEWRNRVGSNRYADLIETKYLAWHEIFGEVTA